MTTDIEDTIENLIRARSFGLTTTNLIAALLIIRQGDETSLGELARELRTSTAAVTLIADSLVKSDLATRERAGSDRRSYHLVITRLGREVADSFLS